MKKQLRRLTTTQQDKGQHLTWKEGKKGNEQNHVLSEGRGKRKPTKLSVKEIENML